MFLGLRRVFFFWPDESSPEELPGDLSRFLPEEISMVSSMSESPESLERERARPPSLDGAGVALPRERLGRMVSFKASLPGFVSSQGLLRTASEKLDGVEVEAGVAFVVDLAETAVVDVEYIVVETVA